MEVEMDFTGMTDEEIAHRLQMQFLAESGQSNENYMTILSNYENAQKDADYAMQLQADMALHEVMPAVYAPFLAPPSQPITTTTTTTTTTSVASENPTEKTPTFVPNTLLETSTTTTSSTDTTDANEGNNDDDELQCLICYEVPEEYVVLPMCKIPHIYCFGCAEKMLENGPQQRNNIFHSSHNRNRLGNQVKQSIQCPLCSAVSQLPSRGLVAFRKRTKKRVINVTQGICEAHNGPLLLYFCYDCLQPVCINCINGPHARHNYTSLDSAYDSCKREVGNQISQLFDEQKKITAHQASLEGIEETINKKTAQRLSELKKQMDDLRKELDRQEAAFENAIVQMQREKLPYATERLEKVNKGLQIASQALNYNSQPLQFFQVLAENEDELSNLVNAKDNNPMATVNNYDLPSLPFADIQHRVSSLRYVDRKKPNAAAELYYSSYDSNEDSNEEEDEGYYS